MNGFHLHWSVTNEKLRQTDTVAFGLPAFRARDGFVVCPGAAACASFCYARQGWYSRSRVVPLLEFNLSLIRFRGLGHFEAAAVSDLRRLGHSVVRVHDSGDFFSQAYLDAWYRIARRVPRKRFYSYTKSLHLDLWTGKPENFGLVQSEGGKFDAQRDDARPTARVFLSERQLEREGYEPAIDDDAPAIMEVDRVGLVYHGQRKMRGALARAVR